MTTHNLSTDSRTDRRFRRNTVKQVVGWLAVASSTALATMWAVWGSIENFHEGWYYRELWRNLALAAVQYLPWMFVPMLAGLVALWRPWLGVAAHLTLAAAAVWRFGMRPPAGFLLIAVPLVALAGLYAYGRPVPVSRARRLLLLIPLAAAVLSGAQPGWRAMTRPATVDPSMREIAGNGVRLVWAPRGPGWNRPGLSWAAARDTCARLTPDGLTLATTRGIWRLPTVDEAVRTMTWRGANAGGVWHAAAGTASFDRMPDKEAPLWDPFSQVIYWWTSDEVDAAHAYRVVYNGLVTPLVKTIKPAYLSCRCVRERSGGN
jgi:hypothetical protein